MVMFPGGTLSALRQLSKGPYTNDPEDANYSAHWQSRPLEPDETVSRVLTGTMGENRIRKTMVNIRVTDRGRYYVDTPNVEAVGPVASTAKWALGRLSDPLVLDAPQVEVGHTKFGTELIRIPQSADAPTMVLRTPFHVGRPSDLTPRNQMRNLWQTLTVK